MYPRHKVLGPHEDHIKQAESGLTDETNWDVLVFNRQINVYIIFGI